MKQTPTVHNAHLEGDPFFWEGGPAGILLSHGYTATTAEVRLLAERLHRQGYTVSGPLLPGHGTTPNEMNRCRWRDWDEALEAAYQQLAAKCERVFVGGESMGAMLALQVAARHPQVAGILAYAPAFQLHRKPRVLSFLLSSFVSHMIKNDVDNINPNWKGYAVNPLRALRQLVGLQKEVGRHLNAIRQPLLIVQGRLDTAIDMRGAEMLYHGVGSNNQRITLDGRFRPCSDFR